MEMPHDLHDLIWDGFIPALCHPLSKSFKGYLLPKIGSRWLQRLVKTNASNAG
jgi:hypothetical protein